MMSDLKHVEANRKSPIKAGKDFFITPTILGDCRGKKGHLKEEWTNLIVYISGYNLFHLLIIKVHLENRIFLKVQICLFFWYCKYFLQCFRSFSFHFYNAWTKLLSLHFQLSLLEMRMDFDNRNLYNSEVQKLKVIVIPIIQ